MVCCQYRSSFQSSNYMYACSLDIMCVSAQGEMVMAKIGNGLGKDLVRESQLRIIHPNDYMIAHLMASVSRDERKKMYDEMLAHGMRYKNDQLALMGLEGVISYILKAREVSTENSDDFLDAPLNKKKEGEILKRAEQVVDLLEEIVTNHSFYQRESSAFNTNYLSNNFEIALPKTWAFVIKKVSSFFMVEKTFEIDAKQVLVINTMAFDLYCKLGTTKLLQSSGEKVKSGEGYGWEHFRLVTAPFNDVLSKFKTDVNTMSLERVIFWLKYNGGELPPHILKILRIEYARKGGSFKLE